MADFFSQQANILGFIIDIENFTRLQQVKNEIIRFSQTLESHVEDKIYLYNQDVVKMNRWISESVADIANYKTTKIDLEIAIINTISILSLDESDKKHLFYIFDRTIFPSHLLRRLQRGIKFNTNHETNVKIWLLDLNDNPNQELLQLKNCTYIPGLLYSSFFKGLFHDQ